MKTLVACALLLVGCGGLPSEDPPAASLGIARDVAEQPAPEPVRCTAQTMRPEWECCDDDGISCGAPSQMLRCQDHQLVPMTDEDCRRNMNDPRRPELATYGTFCDHLPDGGWLTCDQTPPVPPKN